MESLERMHTPEIKTEELLVTVRELQLYDYEHFTYNGTHFLVIFGDEPAEGAGPEEAVFHTSTVVDFDIYLLGTIPDERKRRMIFHEAIEADLRRQGVDGKASHDLARKSEEDAFGMRT